MVCSEILLPPHAPTEYADRQTLWNAVEKAERHPKAQLAYSFDIALQNEFSIEENIALARQFLLEQFVRRGMICDFAIHQPDKEGGVPNPHFHVLCPIRPIEENGKWGNKQRREYTGCTVNFKTYTNSIWDKKQRETPLEKQAVFYGTHPAIIEQEVFDKVQKIRQQRHRRTKTGKSHMFSGLVYCADCGAKMRYCTTSYFEKRQDHFVCANYRSNTGSCSAHFIRAVVLEEMVWAHMEAVISYVICHEAHFRAVMEERLKLTSSEAIKVRRKKLAQDEKRITELDRLYIRIYEDNAAGRFSDEKFTMMSRAYEDEQAQLKAEVQILQDEIEVQERRADRLRRA